MTAPTGTRSLNKRDIPQAAQTRAHSQVRIQSPIARTGRITRSQSREIPNSDPTQSAARRKRKGTRQASVGSEGSSLDTDIDTARKGSVIDGADTLEGEYRLTRISSATQVLVRHLLPSDEATTHAVL
jgi:hypothetical protein